MRVPNLWPFQLPVLDPVANSGQGCQQPAARRVQPLPAARAGVARGPHDGVRIYRLPRPAGTGSLPQRPDTRARGATRKPLIGDDNRSPGGPAAPRAGPGTGRRPTTRCRDRSSRRPPRRPRCHRRPSAVAPGTCHRCRCCSVASENYGSTRYRCRSALLGNRRRYRSS